MYSKTQKCINFEEEERNQYYYSYEQYEDLDDISMDKSQNNNSTILPVNKYKDFP